MAPEVPVATARLLLEPQANRFTFHHLVGELLGKRVGTARPGESADDLIEHGSHIDIRSARLFAGAHSAQVCSFHREALGSENSVIRT